MSRSDAHRLADMVMAIDEIAAIVERGRPAFDGDVVLRRAVERCLEIIGEAAKSVSPAVTEAHPEIPWSDMAKVRDRLSHHYHRVDQGQLWTIAVRRRGPLSAADVRRPLPGSAPDCEPLVAVDAQRRDRVPPQNLARTDAVPLNVPDDVARRLKRRQL